MPLQYKKLGNYIREVDVKNTDLKVSLLLGVSITKKFIPSIANIIGTDLSKYKIVRKGQFAYGPVTSRNGDQVSIALLEDNECIISTSYTVFEISKPEELLNEYLMLLFSNPEFDRYARYNSWGSAREIFSWDELCNAELYLPDIEEQKKIVKEYWAITEQIVSISKENIEIQKLGVLDLCNVIGFESLVNKTDNELSEFNLPKNCSISTVKDFCKKITSGGTPNRANPEYYNGSINWLKSGEVHNNIITHTEENISELGLNNSSAKIFPRNTVLMAMYGVTAGEIGLLDIETSTNQAICGMICNNIEDASFLYFTLRKNQIDIKRLANGGAQDNLNQETIKATKIIIPNEIAKKKLHCSTFMNRLIINSRILYQLQKMLDLLLLKIR